MWTPEDELEVARAICDQLANGKSLRKIVKQVGYPSIGVFLRWCRENETIAQQYARALETRTEGDAHELEEIAKNGDARLQADVKKWLMSKRLPKKYGETRQRVDNFNFNPDDFNNEELTQIMNGADPLDVKRARTRQERE